MTRRALPTIPENMVLNNETSQAQRIEESLFETPPRIGRNFWHAY